MSDKTRNIVTWIVSALVGLAFLMAGSMKTFVQPAEAAAQFETFGLPGGMALFIGICEIAGGIGVLIPRLAGLAASGLVIIMVGAVYSHVTHDPVAQAVPALAIGLLCGYVAYARGLPFGSGAATA